MSSYDEALAKALRGEGMEELDQAVRRSGSSFVPIRTDNAGEQNTPDIGMPDDEAGNGGAQEDSMAQLMIETLMPGHYQSRR